MSLMVQVVVQEDAGIQCEKGNRGGKYRHRLFCFWSMRPRDGTNWNDVGKLALLLATDRRQGRPTGIQQWTCRLRARLMVSAPLCAIDASPPFTNSTAHPSISVMPVLQHFGAASFSLYALVRDRNRWGPSDREMTNQRCQLL